MTTTPQPPLAAIAAYMGAPCSYEYYMATSNQSVKREVVLDAKALYNLHEALFDWHADVSNFRVRLKSLHLLTNKQVKQLAALVGVDGDTLTVERSENHVCCFDEKETAIWLWFGGYYGFQISYEYEGETSDEFNPARIIRQLIEWGFWLPGFLDEQFVELITKEDE